MGTGAPGHRIGDDITLQFLQLKLEIQGPRGVAASAVGFDSDVGPNIDWVEVRWHVVQYKSAPVLTKFPNTWFERYRTALATTQDQGLRFLKSGSVRFNNQNHLEINDAATYKTFVTNRRTVRRTVNVNLKNMKQEYTGTSPGNWRKNIFLIMYAYAARQGHGSSGAPTYWTNTEADALIAHAHGEYHPRVNYDWALYYKDL